MRPGKARQLTQRARYALTPKGWILAGIVAVAALFFALNFAISWSHYS